MARANTGEDIGKLVRGLEVLEPRHVIVQVLFYPEISDIDEAAAGLAGRTTQVRNRHRACIVLIYCLWSLELFNAQELE